MSIIDAPPWPGMSIRLLGHFDVRADGHALPLPRHRQRAIIALLALRANDTISVDHIVDAVWGGQPPLHVRNQIQVHVCGLRRLLAAAGLPRDVLVTWPTGYQLDLVPGSRDLDELNALVASARRAVVTGELEHAATELRAALGLWHGQSLDGVEGEYVRAESAVLEERRLTVLSDYADVQLARGRPGDVVPDLTAHLSAHPLNEGLRLHLMLALSNSGRRAEALAVYRDGRRIMVTELGLEPGLALRLAEASILRGEAPEGPPRGLGQAHLTSALSERSAPRQRVAAA